MRHGNRPFWQRHFRTILWGIAIACLIVSIATRFRFTLIFLPLVFAPALVGLRRGGRGD